jgi:AraC-like DNA-binding protein/mannose-6-phosphate isomerase-like protein (cupin superfamily)
MSAKRHTVADEPHFMIRTLSADFEDGRALAPHAHPWGQLIYAASGVMSVWTGQGSWVAPPHWAVWAPAGVAHALRFTGRTSLRTLYLRPERWPGLPETSAVIGVPALLRELILRAVELGMLDEREPGHVALAELVVHELRARPAPALELPLPRSARLRRVAEHLAGAPADRSGHAALARRFGIGARTLERGFAAETGLSLGCWRRQARFLHALRRLGAGAQVKQVAAEAGYRSPSAFVAAFRSALDTTPGRYFLGPEA